jgi:hypothetical protein
VREIREDEARIDNGLPAVQDLQRNGFTVAACVPLKNLVPWGTLPPRVATAVEQQERILALEAELDALRARVATLAPSPLDATDTRALTFTHVEPTAPMTVADLIVRLSSLPMSLEVACVEHSDGRGVDHRPVKGLLATLTRGHDVLLLVPRGGTFDRWMSDELSVHTPPSEAP